MARIQDRCPSATFRTTAHAPDFVVSFTKPSIDLSGKATMVASNGTKLAAIGAVFEISTSDLDNLNKAEGPGYERHNDFRVACLRTGESIAAHTYMAKEEHLDLKPYDWYLALVIAGIVENELDSEYELAFRAIKYDIDTDTRRKSRQTAIEELQRAGYSDYTVLLQE